MIEHNKRLSALREQIYGRLGAVDAHVVSRLVPRMPWPDSALGRMRIVSRGSSKLLITDGLSAFYNPALHAKPPVAPLDYELGIDVLATDPCAASAELFAESWYVDVLYSVADMFVTRWFDLRGALEQFGAVTLTIPARSAEARQMATPNGDLGVLIGQSLITAGTEQHAYIDGYYRGSDPRLDDAALGLFPLKPIRADELAWAVGQGNSGAVLLADAFTKRGDSRLAWTDRPSVLSGDGKAARVVSDARR